MTTILVLTDLSANARAGVAFSIQLARQITGTRLVFCHFVQIMKPTAWSDKKFTAFAKARLAEKRAEVEEQVNGVFMEGEAGLVDHDYFLRVATDVEGETRRVARKFGADFLCLGTRGGGKLKKLLGSTAANLLRSSTRPVIVVPPVWKRREIRKAIYASDLENPASELKQVLAFAHDAGSSVTLCHYNPQLVVSSNKDALYAKVRKFSKVPGLDFHFSRFAADDTIPRLVMKDVKSHKAALLIMFTRRNRSWFSRLFEPGRSAQVTKDLHVPLLLFRKKK